MTAAMPKSEKFADVDSVAESIVSATAQVSRQAQPIWRNTSREVLFISFIPLIHSAKFAGRISPRALVGFRAAAGEVYAEPGLMVYVVECGV